MPHLRRMCIILTAGLLTAPCSALAQDQSAQSPPHVAAHDEGDLAQAVPAYVHPSHADVRVADHYARLDDSRAEAAWKRGNRAAACRWARAAQKAAGLHRADFAYRVDEYCAQDDGRAN